MSDAAPPTAAEVRAAAEAVKAALDRHLAAVENRTGEDDPAVYDAFNALAVAAETYDERLYDRYDEVTPFEIPGVDESLPPYAGPEEPSALSVLIRRDYAVVEPARLLAQARRIADLDPDEDSPERGRAARTGVHAALGLVFGEYEPDEISSRHKEFGLEEGDSTLWISALDELPEPGEWLNAPFDQTDPQRVVIRYDVSSVFDEEEDGYADEDGADLDDDGTEIDETEDADLDPGAEDPGDEDPGDEAGGGRAAAPSRPGD
ncbi:hypothetical protein [Streptomyces clavuligerus]|uniref:Uncharacterized protein n=1 Tax=Streptomyces clavuligerus TaxID=1901 RepID=E2PWE2_STRCL|nr:hypothetical protein [Streptomyces clavuligerus]ANW20961.1 hypothetical protein BB341_23485 [Streptomyces clavuligerus]AXU15579.1 hypothetical protein D1794_24405 [Streptomyces clavuligerus]EFG05975.1 Hypothetical protein SCLAV_0898 [Streptomyces clavuligerus]MBY6305689.1 hypothetical protein [Streptomyces clavuligerus]QCS08358.1 hypothetical protein CRV15_23770 [Streptomyces clavuligerus]